MIALPPIRTAGGVDTIHHVCEIDIDPNMSYKSTVNEAEYARRGGSVVSVGLYPPQASNSVGPGSTEEPSCQARQVSCGFPYGL